MATDYFKGSEMARSLHTVAIILFVPQSPSTVFLFSVSEALSGNPSLQLLTTASREQSVYSASSVVLVPTSQF